MPTLLTWITASSAASARIGADAPRAPSFLQVPNGISNVRPGALNASGQVAGTATRPGAILTIDSRPYVVRWDASCAPTFLDTTTPSAVAGIEDGSVVSGPDGDQAGPLRLLRGGAPINLEIALPP